MAILNNGDLALPKGSLVLVTGASGYIASNFVVEALKAGYKIRGTARSPAKAQKTKAVFSSPNYDCVVVPEMEPEGAFDEAVKGVDAIVHMSSPLTFSPNPKEVVPPAVNGATSILRSAAKEPRIQRFVFTSSSTSTSLPKPGVRFYIDSKSWNTEVDEYADFPPPYKPENAFKVYSASKTKAEQAVWKFVKDQNPSFTVNCINPAVNMGRVIDSHGETGGLVIKAYKGDIQWDFLPQYMVNVVDCARLHLIALIDSSVKNERILAFDVPFNWNVVLDNFRDLFPSKRFADNQKQDSDISEVDNKRGAELLKKWYGQQGYTGLKESLRQTVEGLD
ncbi:hypothetical protein BKA67DRAFT_573404 [Truncatella angustata]|uniref:NAD-dependent epimerase/dehydratase domain-containing protein n=1 Tax=Truncatella angustata TaxID=152316 RepID=A0A9P8ZWM4_9PEZI|nr:uncharacterized protein BKA67DRAFT_573404 [Truncatella angustata]KAH6652247.1 hypothetical protein BKA67DRAFT_573404 [Truncatella angustata]